MDAVIGAYERSKQRKKSVIVGANTTDDSDQKQREFLDRKYRESKLFDDKEIHRRFYEAYSSPFYIKAAATNYEYIASTMRDARNTLWFDFFNVLEINYNIK